ncbi:hypothetical protein [Yunchengibacter salinarum]|uniref:hypothetical protein n=1 Tax=Yunchengibacter salinarum TaxID=3133399 RepID=UPI0035B639B3
MSDFFANEGMFAIFGVVVGVVLTWLGEFIRQRCATKRRANYLAIRAVIALDAYVGTCAAELESDSPFSDHNNNPDDNFDLPGKFQIPDDVDWTSVSPAVAQRILEIPQRDAEARAAVSFIWRMADGGAACHTRDEHFLEIAHDAAQIADDLRSCYSLVKAPPTEWDPITVLHDLKRNNTEIPSARIDAQEGEAV